MAFFSWTKTTTNENKKKGLDDMSKKWFNDVFLKSIFERSKINVATWLTAKQTDVCISYMNQRTTATYNGCEMQYSYFYEYDWNDRKVKMFIAPNHASQIYFGMTDCEREDLESDNFNIELQRLEKFKNRCYNLKKFDRLNERIKREEESLQTLSELLKDEREDDNDPEEVKSLEKQIQRKEKILKVLK